MRTAVKGRCNVAFVGFGAVGAAIAGLLDRRRRRYLDLYGLDVRVVVIRRSRVEILEPDGIDTASLAQEDPRWRAVSDAFFGEPCLDVLIDAAPSDPRTGGAGLPAVEAVLARGRHVVAVSKGALVHSGPALRALAAGNGAMLELSAAAGAALPALDILRHARGCRFLELEGILNATTNPCSGPWRRRASSWTTLYNRQGATAPWRPTPAPTSMAGIRRQSW